MLCDELKDKWFNAYPEIMGIEGGEPTKCYGKSEVDAAISELKAKLEDVQATAYTESVDADMENRRLKRALWLARAERAVAEQTVDEWSRYRQKHPCGSWRDDPFEYWIQAWINVEKLCRRKAEKYK